MCVNSVFHQLNNSITSELSTLFEYFNLALSYSLDIFVPSITFINRTYSNFPALILSLLTWGNYFVDYNVYMHPLHLNMILLPLKFSITLQEKLLTTKSSYFIDMLGSYKIFYKKAYKLSFIFVGKTQTNHMIDLGFTY